MVTDAFLEFLIAALSFVATCCDCSCMRLTDRIIARADSRMAEQLIDDDVSRARGRNWTVICVTCGAPAEGSHAQGYRCERHPTAMLEYRGPVPGLGA